MKSSDNLKPMWGPAAFIRLLCAVVISFSFQARAEDTKLTKENLASFYDRMQTMNRSLEEGFDELDQWLLYLDEIWADDFKHKTVSYRGVEAEPVYDGTLDKEELKKIYKDIGIDNFKSYQIEVRNIDIKGDGTQADVHYVLNIEDETADTKTYVRCDATAHHVWDEKNQRPIIKSQVCIERMNMCEISEECKIPDEPEK